jgi:ankyrin repeat protein
MIKYLLSVGAHINFKNNFGSNSLHYAVRNDKFDTVKYLISLGCDYRAKNKDGETPLQRAQQGGKKEILFFLKAVERK